MAQGKGGNALSLRDAVDISVVVPSCNERGTIDACLSALTSQDIDESRFEVLLVDGGSTDGTREAAQSYGVRILEDDHNGPAGARNVGIRESRGRIVAFTDADCVPTREWARRMLEVFHERPDVGGVGGALRMPRHGWRGLLEDISALTHYRGFITSNVAYRRDVLLKVGGFDDRLKCAEDWDLACRVQEAGFELVHDRRPVVVHDPPELRAPPIVYLKKDAWYARHDVPAHLRALTRTLDARRADRAATLRVARAVGGAAWNLTLLAAVAGGAAAANPLLMGLGVGGAAFTASRDVLQAAQQSRCDPRMVPPMIALQTTRNLFRGAGTLLGLTDLAAERTRGELPQATARGAPPLPPAARHPPTSP